MVLFVERENKLFFEVGLCEQRHEFKGLFGQIVTRGIFPNTVEKIFDLSGHIHAVEEVLAGIPKEVTVIVYISGCQPLLQALYVYITNAAKDGNIPRIILAHYNTEIKSYQYFCAQNGSELYLQK